MPHLKRILFVLAIISTVLLTVKFFNKTDIPNRPKLLPGEWMGEQRLFPYSEIKTEVYNMAMKAAHQLNKHSRKGGFEWKLVGPTNIGGRITDIEMPEGQSDVIYVGAATGGIFKTEDAGQSWNQLFYDIPTISIGDLAIDPKNSNIIYAGTGEANSSSFSFLGSGIYKSTDAGQSWSLSGLEKSVYIGRVLVDHSNSERIYAAACGSLFAPSTDRGIYRSKNGGSSWEQVLFVSDTTVAIDLVQDPSNADILYAGFWERTRGLIARRSFGKTTGIYKTMDGGDTWTKLTNGLPNPQIEKGRVGLTISKSNPKVLYAMFDMPNEETWVYKTTNAGESWQRLQDSYLKGMGSSFGWYFGQIRVHPTNENMVFALGQVMYRSNNSGSSWTNIDNSGVHVDHHAMFFDLNSDKTYLGNDGGLYYSTDYGGSWVKINNLPITQFYAYDVSETDQGFQVGGTQDNNSIRTLTGSANDWIPILGGDGMYNRINQQNNEIAYAEYQYGELFRSFDAKSEDPFYIYVAGAMAGDRKNWSAPLELTPGQNEIAYFGSHRVWKSTNNGNSWAPISGDLTRGGANYFYSLTSLAVSSHNPAYIMTGSGCGRVNITTNNGDSWVDISKGLPIRWITDVEFDPQDVNTIYATVSGFRWDEALPHIFKSTDLGANWVEISGNLPELPVNCMIVDPENSNRIIVGTDAGIFMTVNGGEKWESITGNLPMVAVVAMKLIPSTKDLYAATYGISTYKINLKDLNVGLVKNNVIKKDFDVRGVNSASTSFIEINNSRAQHFTMRIFNSSGQLLTKRSLGNLIKGSHKINISNEISVKSSVIIVEIIGEKNSSSIKIVV